MSLPIEKAEDLRIRLWGLFDQLGPFLGRDLSVQSRAIRLAGGSGIAGGVAGLPGVSVPRAPSASYQWLHFANLDGAVPAGEQLITIEGEPIPFIGAITEVDIQVEPTISQWQMQVGVVGLGSIFRTSQPREPLTEAGFFRPIPAGFWPETEGLTFPVPSSGLRPYVKFFRPDDRQRNLTVRIFIVAHPSF